MQMLRVQIDDIFFQPQNLYYKQIGFAGQSFVLLNFLKLEHQEHLEIQVLVEAKKYHLLEVKIERSLRPGSPPPPPMPFPMNIDNLHDQKFPWHFLEIISLLSEFLRQLKHKMCFVRDLQFVAFSKKYVSRVKLKIQSLEKLEAKGFWTLSEHNIYFFVGKLLNSSEILELV